MSAIPDDAITNAIQGLGKVEIQRLQQELTEGSRNREPRGYVALRGLLRRLELADSASTDTSDAADNQKQVIENLRVIKAAYDASGGDLPKTMHWFRLEQLAPFGQKTAEQMVAIGRGDDVIRLIDSLRAGVAG